MLPDKYAEETIIITFDFGPTVEALGLDDETMTGTLVTLNALAGGTSLTNVQQQEAGLRLIVLASGGVKGRKYAAEAIATFSNGERRKLRDTILVR